MDNARAIWDRFRERTRYEVNERAEQLRSIGNLSALVAGFAMTSFLQFTFNNSEAVKAVILGFGISTALVVRFIPRSWHPDVQHGIATFVCS